MKKILSFLLILCLLPLVSCKKQPERYTAYYFDYFDTATTIVGYAESKAEFDAVCAGIAAELETYHRLYTIYNLYDGVNNLCALNRAEGALAVDARIIDMLTFAKEMYTCTNGRTNVAMGSVLSLWHDARTQGTRHPESAILPPMEKLIAAAEHTDIADLVLDAEHGTVTRADPALRLDVGAVAKGYAVEQVARSLEAKGVSFRSGRIGGDERRISALLCGRRAELPPHYRSRNLDACRVFFIGVGHLQGFGAGRRAFHGSVLHVGGGGQGACRIASRCGGNVGIPRRYADLFCGIYAVL